MRKEVRLRNAESLFLGHKPDDSYRLIGVLSRSTTDSDGDCKVVSVWGVIWLIEEKDYWGTTLKMALELEAYTNPSAPSMRLNRPPFPPL